MKRAGSLLLVFVLALLVVQGSACSLLTKRAYKVGDTIDSPKVKVTIGSVDVVEEVCGAEPPKPEAALVVVKMRLQSAVKEMGAEPAGVQFAVVTKEKKRYTDMPGFLADEPYGVEFFGSMETVRPGEVKDGAAIFYVAKGATLDYLEIGSLFKDPVKVDLGAAKVKPAPRKTYKVGERIELGGIELTVHGATSRRKAYHSESGFWSWTLPLKKGTKFVEVEFSVKNAGRKTRYEYRDTGGVIGASSISGVLDHISLVKAPNGSYYGPISNLGLGMDELLPKPSWWNAPKLKKGERFRGKLSFAVPDKPGKYVFQFREPSLGPPAEVLIEQ